MSSIFDLTDEDDPSDKIDIDDLFESQREKNLLTLNVYNKILNKIHLKIKTASRQRICDKIIWYIIPQAIIGVPHYNQTECIAYVMHKLDKNGFVVRYTHPSLLFISWNNYVPSYVRSEIKKKTGNQIDEFGNIVSKPKEQNQENENEMDEFRFDNFSGESSNTHLPKMKKNVVDEFHEKRSGFDFRNGNKIKVNKDGFRDVNAYKPTGGMIYDKQSIESFQDKMRKQ